MRLCVCRAQVEAEADEIYCAAIDKVTSDSKSQYVIPLSPRNLEHA